MNWKEWFTNTKKYPIYHQQELEVAGILRDLKFSSVLDVGCGNKRFNSIFYEVEYRGLDLVTGWDASQGWDVGKFDLVFSSLFLMVINKERARDVIQKMFKTSNKYVFCVEETDNTEAIISQDGQEKFYHNYEQLAGIKPSTEGKLECNPVWKWFLWKI